MLTAILKRLLSIFPPAGVKRHSSIMRPTGKILPLFLAVVGREGRERERKREGEKEGEREREERERGRASCSYLVRRKAEASVGRHLVDS